MAVFLVPELTKIFRSLIAAGSFPASLKTTNITPLPKVC